MVQVTSGCGTGSILPRGLTGRSLVSTSVAYVDRIGVPSQRSVGSTRGDSAMRLQGGPSAGEQITLELGTPVVALVDDGYARAVVAIALALDLVGGTAVPRRLITAMTPLVDMPKRSADPLWSPPRSMKTVVRCQD